MWLYSNLMRNQPVSQTTNTLFAALMNRATHLSCLLILIVFLPFRAVEAQYILMGDADYFDNSACIMLTPDEPYKEGIAWSESKIDLNNPFFIVFDLYLGDKDDAGADGICFVMQNDPRQFGAYGTYGEGIGYGRFNPYSDRGTFIAPSIAIEFDTYQNLWQNDPPQDHIAYLENGSNQHLTYWPKDDINFRLTDDALHNFRFEWDPYSKIINVYFDFELVLSFERDLVDSIFGGNALVVWGFTSSTGRKHNLQYFCLNTMAKND